MARCGTFSSAALDLGCAQSAVSRAVASLEAHFQQTLILRGHRKVSLTTAGELYLETVNRALDELDHGARRISTAGERPSLKILAMPAFASRWLVPRLVQLQATGLEIEIELATSIWDADFRKERFDLAIHYGDGSLPGEQLLMHDNLVPVASPRLLGGQMLERIEDIQRFTWLHDSLRSSKWPHWLAVCGASGFTSHRSMKLQDTEAALNAAVAGLGVAMGHGVLIDNDLREGRLQEVWPVRASLAAGYHLIHAKRAARSQAARRMADWLMNEAEMFQATTADAGR